MQQKARFLSPVPQVMTAKPARRVPVLPVMNRNSVTDAVPAGICHENWTGAMPMREHITINPVQKPLCDAAAFILSIIGNYSVMFL